MFDDSLLPPADWAFVLLADTHYMLETPRVEFESRRQQTARIDHAVRLINALDPTFVVHLGDLVQEFPGSGAFDTAMDDALGQLDRLEADCHYVPGNHDVGDKPDPTMPTKPVSSESLAAYHERFGRSWYRWDVDGIAFIAVNSQLLNSALPAAEEQRAWLETELRDRVDGPAFLFSHLPPFLHGPEEPGLGHYDNVGRPAREWLLELVRDTPVTHVCAAHTHFQFRNRIGDAAVHVVPSPAFTRPGFGELFSSCPPPERGRDDRPKLGFYLVRMRERDPTFHFIRTGGATDDGRRDGPDRLLSLPTAALPASRLGVSLVHPFGGSADVPATFPASIQHRVRDDYPLLGCLELGASFLRLPMRDGHGSVDSRHNLGHFRRRGGTVVGTVLLPGDEPDSNPFPSGDDLPPATAASLDEVELQLAGSVWPSATTRATIDAVREAVDVPIGLSVVVPDRSVPGAQHDRQRVGYRPPELEPLADRLGELDASVDRVVCRLGAADDPWGTIRSAPDPASLARIGGIDWLLPSIGLEESTQVDRLSCALLAVATVPDARLYVEPLRTLDRTMDTATGLLDRQRNPTTAFHVARCLNSVLFGRGDSWRPQRDRQRPAGRLLGAASADRAVTLALPADTGEPFAFALPDDLSIGEPSQQRRMELTRGTSTATAVDGRDAVVDSPTLFLSE